MLNMLVGAASCVVVGRDGAPKSDYGGELRNTKIAHCKNKAAAAASLSTTISSFAMTCQNLNVDDAEIQFKFNQSCMTLRWTRITYSFSTPLGQ